MARVVHFGITNADMNMTPGDVQVIARTLEEAWRDRMDIARGFTTDGDSFTAWGEPLESRDALHVMHVTDCETHDEDDEPIRLSDDEVAEIADCLLEIVSLAPGYRVVDHWVEGDYEVQSDDNYIHGPFALASVCGKSI